MTMKQDYAVLFVDDEPEALRYFKRACIKHFPVHTASSVEEAKKVLEAKSSMVGLILSDVRMPKENGVSLLTYAHQEFPLIFRWLVTAHCDMDAAIEAINQGAVQQYRTKPWDLRSLREDLKIALQLFAEKRADLVRREKALSYLRKAVGFFEDPKELVPCLDSLGSGICFTSTMDQFSEMLIRRALADNDGSVRLTAKFLKISTRSLRYRMEKLGIPISFKGAE